MTKIAPLVLVVLGLLFATGCGGGSSKSSTTAQLRFVNAVADSVGVPYDVLADSSSFATGVGFKSGTAYIAVSSGSHQMEVRNTGTTADLLAQTINVAGGSSYTYLAGGAGAAPAGILLTDTTTAATSGNIQVRIVNATGGFGSFDAYINPPGTDITTVTADVSNLGFGANSGYKTLAAATYQISITKPGENSIVYLFTGGIDLKSGTVITIVIVGPSTPGGFPLDFIQATDAT